MVHRATTRIPRNTSDLMKELEDLARKCLEQHFFVGSDGLLHTPLGRTARSTIRVGRTVYPATHVIAEMRRQAQFLG